MIRIVIADDQELFAETLKMVIEKRAKDIRVAGLAHSGEQAVQAVEKHAPYVVLMDVRMPGMDGVHATKVIHERFPDVQIVMLTTYDDDEYILEALRHGAVGYLLKSIPPIKLIDCIRSVKNGNVLISPEVAKKLIDHVYHTRTGEPKEKADDSLSVIWHEQLSRREREILSLIAEGCDNKQIADRLFLADQTVKNHISVIYSKLGVRDRVKLAMLAQDMQKKSR
jgi:DNA-binding NarL/FixJ family response regulator